MYDSIIQCLTETNQLSGLQDDENIENEIQAQITCYKAFRYNDVFSCFCHVFIFVYYVLNRGIVVTAWSASSLTIDETFAEQPPF